MKKNYTYLCKKIAITFLFMLGISAQISAQDVYVDQTASGSNNGTSWTDAYTLLSDAFTNASDGETIYVAKGTYTGLESSTAFTIGNAITVKGGYPSGGGTQDIANNETILDGSGARRILNITKGSTLNGLTIQNGVETDFDGAGIRFASSCVIEYCIVKNNACSKAGDGDVLGGGIYAAFNLTMTNTIVTGNSVTSTGATTTDEVRGGGVYVKGTLSATNCFFGNNTASSSAGNAYGAGLYVSKQSQFYNCAIVKNSASSNTDADGAGLYASGTTGSSSKAIRLRNSIMWENTASEDGGTTFTSNEYSINGPSIGFFSAITSLVDGQNLDTDGSSGNIDDSANNFDPGFTDAANGDYSLLGSSQLIDKGTDSFNDSTLDLAYSTRKVGVIDIGPYEQQNPTLSTKSNHLLSVSIYPNPSSDFIAISGESIEGNYTIYTFDGRTIKSGKLANNRISVSNLNSGMYLLNITSQQNTLSKRILIE